MTLAVSSRNRARPQPSPSAADVSCGSGRGADEQVGRRAGTRWQNAKAGNCFGWCEVGVVKEHRPTRSSDGRCRFNAIKTRVNQTSNEVEPAQAFS
jgi:hypothetical protein